jgi:transposase
MRKYFYVVLPVEERAELEHLIHAGVSPARQQTRARILLLCDRSEGQKRTDEEVADAAMCNEKTVYNVRHRYKEGGLWRALHDKDWPGAPPKLTGEIEAQLTLLACSAPPEGHARWTLRLLADRLIALGSVEYVSHVTVREWLKKTNLSLGK